MNGETGLCPCSSLGRRLLSLDVTGCISSALWKLVSACFCSRDAGPFVETQQPRGSQCHLPPSAQAQDLCLPGGGGLMPPPPAEVCVPSLSPALSVVSVLVLLVDLQPPLRLSYLTK